MTIKLISQIDILHWTVLFLDEKWKDKTGDFKLEANQCESGDKLKVKATLYPKITEPTQTKYSGVLEIINKK